ncbi:heme-binding protein [Arthrobacter sp. PAMC25564]|uniref:SOUL family heme-binding protein n=1 Tax=Arthrobacter sp. PAMC25564 TaxID=2565366 RepID=UPI0010A26950|nr:heme-binding protein [Arthrobacter sp. PAMC25564]QCB98627.1 heme-binding protein [Arthrobacter sp. PAMC25564]
MTEQQPFELVQRFPDFELRRYPPHVVAEVTVGSSFDRAGNLAFRQLFNYISGNNTARQTLAMTAPVIQGFARSQKVPMTAPVLQRGSLEEGEFVVSFVLPADMTEETAPVPADPEVRIGTVPTALAAVVGFSGSGSKSTFEKRNRELQAAIAAAALTATGLPRFARFDPPFKPWFLRHNEVLQDVEEFPTGPGMQPGGGTH